MLLNYDQIMIGDRLKVALSGDHGMNVRGPAGTNVSGTVTALDQDTRVVTLDQFLAGVNEDDEVVEHVRMAQKQRDCQSIDRTGDDS